MVGYRDERDHRGISGHLKALASSCGASPQGLVGVRSQGLVGDLHGQPSWSKVRGRDFWVHVLSGSGLWIESSFGWHRVCSVGVYHGGSWSLGKAKRMAEGMGE